MFDIEDEAGSVSAACTRIREQPGINPDTLRGWVTRVEIDTGHRLRHPP